MGAGWPGTTYLCKFILDPAGRALIHQKRVLEIGAGNGLPSFLCAQAGAAEVIPTDGDATEVAMLKKSVAEGYVVGEGCRFEPRLLWWGYPAGEKQMPERKRGFDVILACEVSPKPESAARHPRNRFSDGGEVCYNPNDVQLVADTIDYFLSEAIALSLCANPNLGFLIRLRVRVRVRVRVRC